MNGLRFIEITPAGAIGGCCARSDRTESEIESIVQGTRHFYRTNSFTRPWIGYLAIHDADESPVGACAFKSPPRFGQVEIAYHTFTDFVGRGVATSMVCELIRIARAHDPSLTLRACTLAQENASTAVLKKCGFVMVPEQDESWNGLTDQWRLPLEQLSVGSANPTSG